MRTALLCFILSLCFLNTKLKADSPLTSTYFATAYYNYDMVEKAEFAKELTDEIAGFLLDVNNPIDAKVAVINAIGWSSDMQSRGEKFKEYLAKAHNTTTEKLLLTNMTSDELLCLGYIMAMDDYFVVDEAINILEMAVAKNKTSLTTNLILAMTKAQKAMDTDFCRVWTLTSAVLQDDNLKRDMKTSAIQTIVDYMILYKADCVY